MRFKLCLVGVLSAVTPLLAEPTTSAVLPTSSSTVVAVETSTYVWRSVSNTVFGPGEKLQFVIKWGVITAGQSSLRVEKGEMISGRPTIQLITEAKSTSFIDTFSKVRDRSVSWLDVGSLLTVKYEIKVREGRYKVDRFLDVDQPNQRWYFKGKALDEEKWTVREGTIPPHVTDALGSLYFVRTQPLVVGQSIQVDVLDGRNVYPLRIDVKERETIKVPAGKFDCFLVEPHLRDPGIFISKGKKMEVWITADERRMPVRMRSEVFIGHVAAELTRFEVAPPTAPE